MNFIIWIVIGGVIGWVASLIMRTDGQQGILLNIVVGIVGSLLGGWLISPMVENLWVISAVGTPRRAEAAAASQPGFLHDVDDVRLRHAKRSLERLVTAALFPAVK